MLPPRVVCAPWTDALIWLLVRWIMSDANTVMLPPLA